MPFAGCKTSKLGKARCTVVTEFSTLVVAFAVGETGTEPRADVALASRPAAASDTERIRFPFFSIGVPLSWTALCYVIRINSAVTPVTPLCLHEVKRQLLCSA
jgi:hypothetical protein